MNPMYRNPLASLFERLGKLPRGVGSVRGKAAKRTRRLRFEHCESRNLLAGASIMGVKFDTANSSGFSPGDVPLGGVFIDLYKDNGDLAFSTATDTLADRQQTAAGTGAYTFSNVVDGHYFIQEEVPTGYTQSAGPAFYTVDVIGGAVFSAATQNIDNFTDPNPASTFFISALNPNPYLLQTSGAGIIGGQRDLLVNVLGPTNPISANGFVGTVAVADGVFNLGSASNGPGTEVTMQYDGTDADTTALNNAMGLTADLTANGNNGIRLDFNFLQVGTGTTMDLHISATSPGGGTASFSGLITQDPSGFSVFVPFSSFSTAGTFSFANVSSLQFSFNQSGVQDVDYEITQIVGAQQRNTGFNFGNFPTPVSLSGFKYVDSNNNGTKEPGELPIQGVIITVTGTNDLGQPVNISTQTDANGFYSFDTTKFPEFRPSKPGTFYTLTETPPINFIIGKPHVGSLNGTIVTNTQMSNIVVNPGNQGIDYDFGELGLTPPFVSKRLLILPAPPVVLTAVYDTTTDNLQSNSLVDPATTVGSNQVVFDSATGTLSVGGTSGNDTIVVAPDSSGKDAQVTINGHVVSNNVLLASIQQIDIFGFDGNDTITVANLAKPVNIDAGAGTDKLIVNGSSNNSNFVLSATSLTMNGATYDLSNVDSLTINGQAKNDTLSVQSLPAFSVAFNGGAGTDTLIGPNATNTWKVTAASGGTFNASLSFSAVENLTGGSSDDTFNFQSGQKIVGKIDGGSGSNTLTYGTYNKAVAVNLQSKAATLTGGFNNLESFVGGAAADTLTGANQANLWTITGNKSGSVNGVGFAGFENLTGGNAADTFQFATGGSISGKISGGAGVDTLDYSADAAAATVNLQTLAATGTGGFAGIEGLIGSSTTTLIGANKNSTWNITDSGSGNVNGLSFSGVGNLTGGTKNDTFVFADGASLTGKIDGGAGKDTLNYLAYTTVISVDLAAGTATNIGAGFSNIEVVLSA